MDLFRKRTVGNDPSDGVLQPDFKKIAGCFAFGYRLISNRIELDNALPILIDSHPEIVEIISTRE